MTTVDSFVDALVRRLASFDREALGALKAQGQSVRDTDSYRAPVGNDMFYSALARSADAPCHLKPVTCDSRLTVSGNPETWSKMDEIATPH